MRIRGAAAPLLLLATVAGAVTLPLRPGGYVQADTPCRTAPFAAMAHFDGRGIGGPHATRCRTDVLARRGTHYRIATTCTADGDGSPAPPSTVRETIRIFSPTRFARIGPGGATTYRRCAAID